MIRRKSISKKILMYLFFLLLILLFGGPLVWIASLSLKGRAEIFAYPPKLFPAIPQWNNYSHIIQTTRIPVYLWNSIKITFWTVLGGLLVTVPAGFAFSRFRFRGRKSMLFCILAFQMISALIIAIPLFRYFDRLDLLDSHLGVVLIYITIQIPFTVWLLKGFFDSIPVSLDEAARIDGCNRMQTLLYVILPLSMSGIVSAIVFNVINAWSQFIIPFVLLVSTEKIPISVGILHLQSVQSEGEITTHLLAAGSMLAILPVLLVFIVLQRFIVAIMIEGAVKG